MSKSNIAAGLNDLLKPTAAPIQGTEATPNTPTAPVKGKNKTVCYSLPVDVIEAMKYIAYYDRRHLNAVITDAFNEYIERWNGKDHVVEKPKKI